MVANVRLALGLSLGLVLLTGVARADTKKSAQSGKPDLKSVGPLAFGPNGILFVGDPKGAAVFAIETGDTAATSAGAFKVEGIGEKIAGAMGIDPKKTKMLITDMAVNPISGNAYLGVSRGTGPDALPVIVKIDRSGKVELMGLDNVKFTKAELSKAASTSQDAITQLEFIKGRLYIAGLSSEAFSSKLRSIPYPFAGSDTATGVEIYHGSHGRFETKSPIRTFTAFDLNGETNLLAAYTCTPLVRIPLQQLKPGENIKGTTVAELGNHNRPLDMVVYQKDGKDFVLMANNARGLMKVALDNLASVDPITKHVTDKAGLKYKTLESYKNNVQQMSRLDKDNVLLLLQNGKGGMDLESIPLP